MIFHFSLPESLKSSAAAPLNAFSYSAKGSRSFFRSLRVRLLQLHVICADVLPRRVRAISAASVTVFTVRLLLWASSRMPRHPTLVYVALLRLCLSLTKILFHNSMEFGTLCILNHGKRIGFLFTRKISWPSEIVSGVFFGWNCKSRMTSR